MDISLIGSTANKNDSVQVIIKKKKKKNDSVQAVHIRMQPSVNTRVTA